MLYPDIQHHGAVSGVTGSCHQLLMDAQHSLLVDCGLFQGAETSAEGKADASQLGIDFAIRTLKALVLTHVHMDHVGRLPYLLAAGYKGPILCSQPSAHLLPLVLEDAFQFTFGRNPQQLQKYLKLIRQRLMPLPYRTWHSLIDTPDLQAKIRLQRAGHILGSAYIECDLRYPKRAEQKRIVFSGDLGATHTPLLPAPKSPWKADILVLESTYGDRLHEDRRTRKQRLKAIIEQALADNGTVLIPAFSIGRTQELLYELEDIIHRAGLPPEGPGARETSANPDPTATNWPTLPIILDSPLATRFTQAYRDLQPYWDAEAQKRIKVGRKPLGFEQLLTVETHDAHLRMVRHLASTARPAIVIAGNGMCSGGRIVNYLKTMLGDKRHNVLFVGYQARGTPGQIIQQFGPKGGYVDLDNERFEIRAGIHTVGGYSAHADQQGLVNFVTRMRHWPNEIRLVHGETEAKKALRHLISKRYGKSNHSVAIRTSY
ncbi:MBL fold metallo-hydrolase RNA specificity domain-containing protein [Metapseudomonas boanensis]|uniref:MBL fold metallo-hydrolase n=1 Tax=Metapseudomonas boanensis TaxID=2822138 RepID=A0ABS5XDK0_9GAMM|nr:MBL fold metallo-hydrolase [Pseudomonas boanensis]MBT8765766.1 MBL fold metallo-hydrolase [Pseudomonas boanensis]